MNDMWLGVDLRTDVKRHVFTRDWDMCSTILHTIVNMDCTRNMYDHIMSTIVFTMRTNEIFI